LRLFGAGDALSVQLAPPLVVYRMAAVESCIPPTAKQVVIDGQSIPIREKLVALIASLLQPAPPSLVAKMLSVLTAKQLEAVGQLMSFIEPAPVSYRVRQLRPPSVVPRMTEGYGPPRIWKRPSFPTAKHVDGPGQRTRINGSVVTVFVKERHEFPPSSVTAISP
jgi:hypothetical protein